MRTLIDEIDTENAKLIGMNKNWKIYQTSNFFYIEENNKIIYYIKYSNTSKKMRLGYRENLSKHKNLTIFMISYLLDNVQYKIYDDITFSKLGYKTLKHCIFSNYFNSYVEKGRKIIEIDEDNFDELEDKLIKEKSYYLFFAKKELIKTVTESLKCTFNVTNKVDIHEFLWKKFNDSKYED